VLVLMDLGNAVLSTETALEILALIKRPTSDTSPEEGLRIAARLGNFRSGAPTSLTSAGEALCEIRGR